MCAASLLAAQADGMRGLPCIRDSAVPDGHGDREVSEPGTPILAPDLMPLANPAFADSLLEPRRWLRSCADASHHPTTRKLSEVPHNASRERNPSRADVHRNRDIIPGDLHQGWVLTEIRWPWQPSRHYRRVPLTRRSLPSTARTCWRIK